jgi:hypothetical protein
MIAIRTACFLIAGAAVLQACSSAPATRGEPRPSYVCTAEASAGFTVREGQWMTINVITTRNYFVTPESAGSSGRGLETPYSITEFGQDLSGPCREEQIPGMPMTQQSVRAITCRILAVPDSAPDFYLNVEGVPEVASDPASVKFPFIRSLFRYPRGVTGGKEDNLDASLLELLEMGTCTRVFKASPESTGEHVVGDCVVQPGSTVIATKGGCSEVDARR